MAAMCSSVTARSLQLSAASSQRLREAAGTVTPVEVTECEAPNSVANELSTLFARAWQRNPLLIMSLDYLGQFAAQLCFVDIRVE